MTKLRNLMILKNWLGLRLMCHQKNGDISEKTTTTTRENNNNDIKRQQRHKTTAHANLLVHVESNQLNLLHYLLFFVNQLNLLHYLLFNLEPVAKLRCHYGLP